MSTLPFKWNNLKNPKGRLICCASNLPNDNKLSHKNYPKFFAAAVSEHEANKQGSSLVGKKITL